LRGWIAVNAQAIPARKYIRHSQFTILTDHIAKNIAILATFILKNATFATVFAKIVE